jgi:hypothetical protein
MEKKIVFTSVEPNKNLLWLHYKNGLLVLQRFGSNGWEDISNSDHITQTELMELLKDKADLVGGKVPAEELPSYVDDIIEFNNIQVADAEISSIIGNALYKNQIRFVNNSTALADRIGSEDKYPDMFVNFGENTSEDDWTTFEPEQGKIYINTTNNHSYRWSGSYLIDLDQSWSQGIKDLQENTIRTDISQDFSNAQQDVALSNIGLDFVHIDYSVIGTTLNDQLFNQIANAKGVIINNHPNGLYVYTRARGIGFPVTFFTIRDATTITACSLSDTDKKLTLSGTFSFSANCVYYIKQTLTDTQKQQARTNMGVQSADELLENADFIAQLKTKLETV